MNNISAFILDIFFPNRCPICGKITAYNEWICKNCILELEKLVPKDEEILMEYDKKKCMFKDNINYQCVITCFYYENAARKGVLSLKYGSKNFGYYIGDLLADKINQDEILKNSDYIVPVPMSKKRLRERRYNQAYVIAKEISRKTKIPILNNAIFKNNSSVQHKLNYEERKKNVSAFIGGNYDLGGKKFIVCDDVLTTGSTLNKCAELLINMGAAEVYGAVGTTTKLKKE